MRADGPSPPGAGQPPLVLHLVYCFATGGLENGIVNLINHMPPRTYRHAVVALTEVDAGFAARIRRSDVSFHALHKPPGHGYRIYGRFWQLLRQLQPAVLHTRNLAPMECHLPAWAAGVPARLHGEHGRDIDDLDGTRRRNQWARRLYGPFVQHYVALSSELAGYLVQKVGVPPDRITQVYNGVDTDRFQPATAGRQRLAACPFQGDGLFVFGTVGRMQPVKAQVLLAQAFVQAVTVAPALRASMRLVMVGDGPQRAEAQQVLATAGLADLAWLPGERSDVPEVMRSLDCFVLPSLAEGISNTILEAMACGLPVLATAVGGNPDLVEAAGTGALVPAGDVPALAAALVEMAGSPQRAAAWGAAGRLRVEQRFSMQAMVGTYQTLYDSMLAARSTIR